MAIQSNDSFITALMTPVTLLCQHIPLVLPLYLELEYFLFCTKCPSFIFRMVSLTFSECRITTPGLNPNAILPIVFVLNGMYSNFIIYIIIIGAEICLSMWGCCFARFSFCHLSQIHINKDGDLTKTALVYASKVPNKMLYLRGTP